MRYHVVDPAEVPPESGRPCEKRSISDAAGLTELGCHRYVAEPGEQLPLAYHVHERQEEVFYVLEGVLSVETPEGTYEVAAGEAFAVQPESPQRAYNDRDADRPLRVIAVGAPAVDDVSEYEP